MCWPDQVQSAAVEHGHVAITAATHQLTEYSAAKALQVQFGIQDNGRVSGLTDDLVLDHDWLCL